MPDLSILIPSRNEMFLAKTIEGIIENSEADTEVVAVLDGTWAEPPIEDNEKVTLVHLPRSIGQRAAINYAAKISKGKYLMKCDAHIKFGKGFDRILLEDVQPDMTILPRMYNLHGFDWVCPDGHRRYQSPSGACKETVNGQPCGKPTVKEIMWREKTNPDTTSMRFDKALHFQYFPEYKKKQKGDLVETMSILGACFMLSRERYFALNICDEAHGSWGQQGTEVACKTWLSGGRLIVDKRTWFAHLFRTQGGDFGFPYKIDDKQVERARQFSRDLWLNNKWEQAVHPLEWLVEKFAPVPDWHDK